MANVLGTLFGNIASAIREKTGETGTMKPAEFPDKIKEIEVGGGSLAPGVYFAPLHMQVAPPSSTDYSLFTYNGGTYAISQVTGAQDFFKLNEKWDKIIDAAKISLYAYRSITIYYDGKVHFLGGSTKYHYVFDGTTITELNILPFYLDNGLATVYQNKIICLNNSDGYLYEWDKNTDTWAQKQFVKKGYCYPLGLDEKLYFFYSNYVYEYVDGTIQQIAALLHPYTVSGSFGIKDNNLYWHNQNRELFKFDFDNLVCSKIGTFPRGSTTGNNRILPNRRESENEDLSVTMGASNYLSTYKLLVVEE